MAPARRDPSLVGISKKISQLKPLRLLLTAAGWRVVMSFVSASEH